MLRVKYWMSKNLITVKTTDSAIKAKLLLKEHNISHLPVMEKENLLGIITKGDRHHQGTGFFL